MKHLKYLSIFIILSLLGFYIGSQSEISGQGLFFAEVEDRGPASPQTQLQEVFSPVHYTEDRGVVSLTSPDGVNYCELIDGINKYKVNLTADGVKSGDKEIRMSVSGDCDEQKNVVVFDSALCDSRLSYENFRNGFSGENGAFIQGFDMDSTIPMRGLRFYISNFEVTYDEQKEETVEPSLDEVKMLYSCAESFQ